MRQLKTISPSSAKLVLSEIYGEEQGVDIWQEILDSWSPRQQPQQFASFINSLITGTVSLTDPYRCRPVDIEEFMFEPFYLGMTRDEIWPEVFKEVKELNSGRYIEAVLTGAIGTAKTTIGLITQAYQLYLLSCYRNPHAVLGIKRSDEILFIFQSLTSTLAKVVDYQRFKTMIDHSKYFTTAFPYDGNIDSYLKFPLRIECRPVSGKVTASIGQNVYSGVIDEVNFMEKTEKSKKSPGQEGAFDQAETIYNSITMRRKSRFMSQGQLPGVLCIVSSRNYPGQFTDKKELERSNDIKKNGKSPIFLYDKRVWELRPDRFSGRMFNVFAGNEVMKPRVMLKKERPPEQYKHLCHKVPVEYQEDFERDVYQAIRDVLGVSTLAKFPFLHDVSAVSDCMDRNLRVLSGDRTDFTDEKIKVYWKRFKEPEAPRWVHVDLALTSDSAGVAMGYCPEFVMIERGDVKEILPFIHIDFALECAPPRGDEIPFFKIRELLYRIRDRGVNVKWVSFDSYQSKDSQQIMRQRGFMTGEQSIDRTNVPYDMVKTALLDRRLSMPHCTKLQNELVRLEKDPAKGKIDHPMNGSKDIADALAGVVYGLTMRRETWSRHNIPMGQIPDSVSQALVAQQEAKLSHQGAQNS